jgi:hypothetical protein
MKSILFAGTFAGVAMLCSQTAIAADAKAEITIAAQHASLAAGASDVAGVHMHLHHAVNCLEGPNGADFSKSDMNPCQNAGNGAIPDSSDPTASASMQLAVGQALKGLASSDLKTAQSDANATAATLKAIK